MPQTIPQDYLQANILELLGLQNLPRERQLALLDKLTELIQKRVMIRIVSELPENKKAEAEQVFASGTDEEKTAFIRDNSKFQQILEQEIVAVKKQMADAAGQVE